MHATGEKPGKGIYQCINCNQKVKLNGSSDTLPPCPRCRKSKYKKIK